MKIVEEIKALREHIQHNLDNDSTRVVITNHEEDLDIRGGLDIFAIMQENISFC